MRKFFQKIPYLTNRKGKIMLFLASFLIGCLIFFLVIKNIGWQEITKALSSFQLCQIGHNAKDRWLSFVANQF
jgi:hypothetical protein